MKREKTSEIRVAAKVLGELNMPDFDPQLFWVKSRVKFQTPFGLFPGIFSTLDKYQKTISFNAWKFNGKWPSWLPLNIKKMEECPHWSKFSCLDQETGLTLSGMMDECYQLEDETLLIVDNKLAKCTKTQDSLLPMYSGQLNAYADICERIGKGDVSQLLLIYHEPITDGLDDLENFKNIYSDETYLLNFIPKVVEIKRDPMLVPSLLKKAKEIIDMEFPPEKDMGKDLSLVLKMANVFKDAEKKRLEANALKSCEDEESSSSQKYEKVKVFFNERFIGRVSVHVDSDKEVIQSLVHNDPLILVTCPQIESEPEKVTWDY